MTYMTAAGTNTMGKDNVMKRKAVKPTLDFDYDLARRFGKAF